MKLLDKFITERKPSTSVITIQSWDQLSYTNIADHLRNLIPCYSNPRVLTYLFFDDAQDTYSDTPLWNGFFKDIASMKYHVVLFCSYGSLSPSQVESDKGTPPLMHSDAQVSLWPGKGKFGLLSFLYKFA
jgi:hypothetical protein